MKKLLGSYDLNGRQLRNRFVMAPMTRARRLDCIAPVTTDFTKIRRWYEDRASAWTWTPPPLVERSSRGKSEHAIGFEHGDEAFVLIWLDAPNNRADRPVAVQRYRPGSDKPEG